MRRESHEDIHLANIEVCDQEYEEADSARRELSQASRSTGLSTSA